MQKFNKNKIKEFNDYLYYSSTHDAEIENIQYDRKNKTLFIDIFNPIFKESTNFIFCDVQVLLWINGNDFINYGDTNTIMSLSVEEDYSYLQNCDQVCGKNNLDDSIYLLFQMLNQDELHIISKEVCIDVKKG